MCVCVYMYILNDYCGLDKNNHHRPIASGILGGVALLEYMLIEASVSLEVGFEISEAQTRPSGSLSLPAVY